LNIQKPRSFWDEAAARARTLSHDPSEAAETAEQRKPLFREPPSPDSRLETEDQLRLRLAEELDYARRMLDAMGEELVGDSLVLMRHTAALQSVDVVGQILGHIAAIVRSIAPQAAIEEIGMVELKNRLKRRSIG
jgi:hypothetical protein